MNLNVEKDKDSKKRIIMYIIIGLVCILSITVVIGVQVLGNDVVDNIFGINKITKRTEEEEATLKDNFENIFDNKVEDNGSYKIKKINSEKEIVFTNYSKNDRNNKYEINVNLPYINIKNSDDVNNFNNEMEKTFAGKAENIIETNKDNLNNSNNITNSVDGESSNIVSTIYTVKYKAYVENDILSVVIYSDLKQSSSAQRVIVQTFNYDLKENRKLSLEDIINKFDLKENDVQNKINSSIQKEQQKSEDLIKLGYKVFSRNTKSNIYKIENITEYFVYNNNIYIVFAYGNTQMTSEKDIVII